jgi:hypothetical protein
MAYVVIIGGFFIPVALLLGAAYTIGAILSED